MPIEKKKALIVVRTYPTPAKKGIEVSCTAAITDDGKWLRLFPVPYRFLAEDQRFRKYQWVEVGAEKANDGRPESHRIAPDSIKILSEPLSTDHEWRARKNVVFPLKSPSLCAIKRERDEKGSPTLGVFKPKEIKRLIIQPTSTEWSAGELAILSQQKLFGGSPKDELEKVPFDFKYEFLCADSGCHGHTLLCTDWEMGQSWRTWSKKYGTEWESKFRQRYESEMIQKDTHFYVGTVHQYPKAWIIVGLLYPPHELTTNLFDI